MKTETGYVAGVNGNLIKVDFDGSVRKNEVGYILVDDKRLKGRNVFLLLPLLSEASVTYPGSWKVL